MKYTAKEVNKKSKETAGKEVRQKNRLVMFMVTLLVVFFIAAICLCISIGVGAFMEIVDNAPEIDNLEDIRPNASKSILYAEDGTVMQELITNGTNRVSIPFSDMPDHLVKAFVAIEDSRFYTHDGVDVKGIIRAVFVGLSKGKLSEGASTITQQLIKNNIFDGGFENNMGDRLERKFQEQYLALRVEKEVDKNTILQNYLNTINLGSNCLGVQVAAKRYFGKDAKDLDLAEATVLAATTSSPSRYNPITHPDKNQIRREIVLDNMLEYGYISEAEHEAALSEDVYLRVKMNNENYSREAQAFTYFTDTVFEQVSDALQEELDLTETQSYNMLYSGGLRIYTTESPEVQKAMDEEINNPDNYIIATATGERNYYELGLSYRLCVVLRDGTEYYYDEGHVKNYFREVKGQADFNLMFDSKTELENAAAEYRNYILAITSGTVESEYVGAIIQPQVSMVVMDQSNGHVLGIVGGRGNKNEMGSLILNRATQSTRQPGSTFKIVSTYAPAIDTCGATLATTYNDSLLDIGSKVIQNWWGDNHLGYSNIRQAIAYSMNTVAVRCLEDTVTENIAYSYAESLGITTLDERDKSPVFTLGGLTYGTTNLQMTAAYATIANDGVYNKPIFWTKVTDADGNVILENEPESKTVLKPETAKLLTSAMKSSVDNFMVFPRENYMGTNTQCQVSGVPISGKSGTTSDANDLWFIGYSPLYTAGIWSGYDSTKAFGDNPGYHKTIWQKVMTRIMEGKETPADFNYDGLVKAKICSKSGLLAKEGVCDQCGDANCLIYEEYFTLDTAPKETCNCHVLCRICKDSGELATDNCPKDNVEEKIFFNPEAKDIGGETDDTPYLAPANLIGSSCHIHGEQENSSEDSDDESESGNEKTDKQNQDKGKAGR